MDSPRRDENRRHYKQIPLLCLTLLHNADSSIFKHQRAALLFCFFFLYTRCIHLYDKATSCACRQSLESENYDDNICHICDCTQHDAQRNVFWFVIHDRARLQTSQHQKPTCHLHPSFAAAILPKMTDPVLLLPACFYFQTVKGYDPHLNPPSMLPCHLLRSAH